MIQKFKAMLAELKSTAKLRGSVSTKLGITFDERIRAADTKLSEGNYEDIYEHKLIFLGNTMIKKLCSLFRMLN